MLGEAVPIGTVTWAQVYFIVGSAWAAAVPIVGITVWLITRLNQIQRSSDEKRHAVKEEIQKDLKETRHGFYGRTETMQMRLEEKIEDETSKLETRIHSVELQVARIEGANALAQVIQVAQSEARVKDSAKRG